MAPHRAFFEELIAQDPDITLFELRDALAHAEGGAGSSLIHRRFAVPPRVNIQKKSLVASERRRAKVRYQRADWLAHRLPAIGRQPERVVFIDETAVKTNLTCLRGRSLRGQRPTMDAPFGSFETKTMIAGLTHETLIAPWVTKGAMDGPAFAAYVRDVLVPEIEPGTMVILDYLATHKNKAAADDLRAPGCWFLFLPPYSPDLNPIKQAFSKLKAHLRRTEARTFTDVFDATAAICDLYDPQECLVLLQGCRICLKLNPKRFRVHTGWPPMYMAAVSCKPSHLEHLMAPTAECVGSK